jgi:hypothetical protein
MYAALRCIPQTQGKIERWHQTLKNRILLENYFLPGDLEAQIEAFVEHYNQPTLPREPEQRDARRRLLRQGTMPSSNSAKGSSERPSNIAACNTASSPLNINPEDEARTPLIYAASCAKCSDDGHSFLFARVPYCRSRRHRASIPCSISPRR